MTKHAPSDSKYSQLITEIEMHLKELSSQGLLTREAAVADIKEIISEKSLDDLKVDVLSLGNSEFKIKVEDK